jgi:hypothetical protein
MRQLLQKLSQSLAMPNILKLASHHLIVYPFSRRDIRRRPPALHALTLSQFPHGNYFAMHHPHSVSIWLEAAYNPSIANQTRLELWVIERKTERLRHICLVDVRRPISSIAIAALSQPTFYGNSLVILILYRSVTPFA